MNIDWALVVEALKAVAWPIVVAFSLYLFRRPLVELIGSVVTRATKVSLFEVSIELAKLPELHSSWSAGGADVRKLTPSMLFDSYSQALFTELLNPLYVDYAIVDLSTGREWLTSRLFVFALVLGERRGLRTFVFLETAAGIRRRFLGVATSADVTRKLGERYPFLYKAAWQALGEQYAVIPPLGVDYLVKRYLEELQTEIAPPDTDKQSYLEFQAVVPGAPPGTPPKQTWERAQWIDGARLERDLDGVLANTWFEDSPDIPRSIASKAIARRDGAFVALVNSDRQFQGLVDRYVLLDQYSKRESVEKPD